MGVFPIGRASPDGQGSCQDLALIDTFGGGARTDRHGLSHREAEPGCCSNQYLGNLLVDQENC